MENTLFTRLVPVKTVIIFSIGVIAGGLLFLIIPKSPLLQRESVVSYDEILAQVILEENQERAVGKDVPEYGYSYEANTKDTAYDGPAFAKSMPIDSKSAWLTWMQSHRNEEIQFLEARWKLANDFIESKELQRPEDVRAFLLTPREHFVRAQNKGYEYADSWLPIGYGATITDPDVVAMMTTTLAVQPEEKVLEIGTGSGYQSAILSFLTNNVFTIEIIKPLYIETDTLYRDLSSKYPSYKNISRKLGDGYYGWEKYAPFDKIIVTCAIDHIPPPLLKQLKIGGIMVLPLGPPGRQYIMEIRKNIEADGTITLSRRDVYNGLRVSFIPFRDESGTPYYNGEQ
jgi:protein-L-isoaspartate(D-aspartate) O-methyltransferase